MGSRRRSRVRLYRSLQTDGIADRVAGRGARAAGLAGPAADGHAHGPVRRARRLCRTACLLVARRFSRAAHRELSVAPCRRLPDRHGGIVVRRRRGLRLAVDPGGSARHRPGDLRAGHDGAVTRRVCRTGRSRAIRLGGGVSGNERVAAAVGGRLFRARPQSPAGRASCQRRGHDRGAAARPNGVVARRLLLPHVRRVRRVFHLSADPAAGAVRPRAGRCRLSRRRLRRPRDAHAARRWVAGGPDRWRAGAVVGIRRRCPVCAAPDLAVDSAVHGRRARVRHADGSRKWRRVQAGSRALSEGHRDGDGTGRCARRFGGILSAAPARRVPRWPGRHLARVRSALGDSVGAARREPSGVPSKRRGMDAVAADRRTASGRAGARGCVGHTRRGRSWPR